MTGPRDPEKDAEDIEGADIDDEEEATVSPDTMSVHGEDEDDRRTDIEQP